MCFDVISWVVSFMSFVSLLSQRLFSNQMLFIQSCLCPLWFVLPWCLRFRSFIVNVVWSYLQGLLPGCAIPEGFRSSVLWPVSWFHFGQGMVYRWLLDNYQLGSGAGYCLCYLFVCCADLIFVVSRRLFWLERSLFCPQTRPCWLWSSFFSSWIVDAINFFTAWLVHVIRCGRMPLQFECPSRMMQ